MALLTGCDVNDDFDELGDMTQPTNLASYTYQLVDADYTTISKSALAIATNAEDSTKANNIATNKYFTSTVTPYDYIPLLLNNMYKYGDIGSTAKITYNFGDSKPSFLSDLTTVNILTTSDYQSAWGSTTSYVNAFTPATSPSEKLPAILAAKFPSATEGLYKFVEYNYSSTEATSQSTEVSYFFDDWSTHTCATSSPYTVISENGWINKDVLGSLSWYCRVYSTNCAYINGYNSGAANEVWLVSPQIDLSDASFPQFTFDISISYYAEDGLSVYVSEDFNGTEGGIQTATWTDITSSLAIPHESSASSTTFSNVGNADFSTYAGKKIYIAFKYVGDGDNTNTAYKVDNIKVSEEKVALAVPSTEKQYVVYTFDGSVWKEADNSFTAMQPADYTAMGLSYISSTNVPLYLPNYLGSKFPYALDGDVKTVVYKSGSTQTYSGAKQFTLTAGTWVLNDYISEVTDQFKYKSDGWQFVDSDILIGLVSGLNSNLGDFTAYSVTGDQAWAWDNTYGAKISGYSNYVYYDNEDWLISPSMNLSERVSPVMTFNHTGKYFVTMKDEATLWVSTNYSEGAPSTATWTQVTIPTYMAGTDWTYVNSSEINLSAYAGNSNVRIAFKYISTSTPNAAGTWEILNAYVYEKEK